MGGSDGTTDRSRERAKRTGNDKNPLRSSLISPESREWDRVALLAVVA